MKKLIFLGLTLLLITFTGSSIYAQEGLYKAEDNLHSVSVTGTSTLHGWTVSVKEVTNVPDTLQLAGLSLGSIDHFSFGVVTETMDGGRGAAMNKKITTALKSDEFSEITYRQTQTASLKETGEPGHFQLLSTGILSIAGNEQEVEVAVTGQLTAEGQLTFKGSKALKFSDFDIEPPSAMFGQIVCGDEITVHFEFHYIKA